MAVKLFIISVSTILATFVISTTALTGALPTTEECTKKLQSCSLKLPNDQLIELKGPKGDTGATGFPGEQGPKGEKGEVGKTGETGDIGLTGSTGPTGPKGERGENGPQGFKGDSGLIGEKGDTGPQGPRGVKGDKGYGYMGPKGSQGKPGPPGPPGLPGLPGTCPCEVNVLYDEGYENEDVTNPYEVGIEQNPAKTSCKFFSHNNNKTGFYYLEDPSRQSMKVYCNMEKLETCIINNKNSTKYFYTGNSSEKNKNLAKEGPFWMSDRIEMKNLYGVTELQINWLQTISSSVKQTLRYHCNNSKPYSKSNITSSVRLLTWNDVVIGPSPSDKTPLFYSVPKETDYCEIGNKAERYTDIVLQSTKAHRLPIIDVQIRDIRDELQMFYIETVELCFS